MSKIAIFSHACVVEANRELFLELRREHELMLICPSSWKGSLIKELSAEAIGPVCPEPVIGSGNGSLFFYLSSLAKVKAFAPDLIFLDEEPWSLVALQVYLAFPKVPKIFYTKQNLVKKVPPPFSLIQKFVFRRTSGAFVISEEAGTVLRLKSYAGPVQVLPHSLNQDHFRRLAGPERETQRASFGLPGKAFLVGYFGRLTEEKGLPDLLAAAREIRLGKPGKITLVICGNGPLSSQVSEAAKSFPGELYAFSALPHGEVHRLMALMDATVLPSRTTKKWKEQFGRVIIESAACGVPVIGSDSGEIPHLIRRLNCGIVFEERNAKSLAQALRKFYEDPSELSRLSQLGESNVRRDFAHEAVARGLTSALLDFKQSSR